MAEPTQEPITHTSLKKTGVRLPRLFLLSFIPFIIFSVGFIPTIITVILFFYVVTFQSLVIFLLLPFFIVVEILLLFVSELLISGIVIRVFHIKYSEGSYGYSVRNHMAFKWMLLCQLYTPMRKLLEIIPMGGLQRVYLRLVGMEIGDNSLIGGVIKDPCLTEIGSNTTIGEYAILYAHIHDYEKKMITFKKIRVGDGCIIGAGAILMPGVVVEDHAIVAAGAIVPKNRVLEHGKIYGGNPAKEIVVPPKTPV